MYRQKLVICVQGCNDVKNTACLTYRPHLFVCHALMPGRFRLPLVPWLILKQLPLTKYARSLPISIQLTPPVLIIDRKRDHRRRSSSAVLVELEKMAEDFIFSAEQIAKLLPKNVARIAIIPLKEWQTRCYLNNISWTKHPFTS